MAKRTHTSPPLTVHQSTGQHEYKQIRRTKVSAKEELIPPNQAGHLTHPNATEIQRVQLTGDPTGGTFTLTFDGQTTGAINFDDTPAEIETLLLALSNIVVGEIFVSGLPLPGGYVDVEFIGDKAFIDQPEMTATPSLTGGTNPAVLITTIQPGFIGLTVLLKGGRDDRPTDVREESEAPLEAASKIHGTRLEKTGVVTVPTPNEGADSETTRRNFRGNTFGQRMPSEFFDS